MSDDDYIKQVTCGNCNKRFQVALSSKGVYKGAHACDAAYNIDQDGVATPVVRSGLLMTRPEAQPPNVVPYIS